MTTVSTSNSKTASLAALLRSSSSSYFVDILISQVWPVSITHVSSSAPSDGYGVGAVDDIVRKAKPKYHFAVGAGQPPQFWEREPYVWADEEGRVSRFVGLGAFGGDLGAGKKPRVRI